MPFPSVSVFGAFLGGSWNLTLDTLVHLIFLAIFNGCGSSSSVSAVVSSHLLGVLCHPTRQWALKVHAVSSDAGPGL